MCVGANIAEGGEWSVERHPLRPCVGLSLTDSTYSGALAYLTPDEALDLARYLAAQAGSILSERADRDPGDEHHDAH